MLTSRTPAADSVVRRPASTSVKTFQEELNALREKKGNVEIYTYNFPCSFALELIDDSCRVMLYGHKKGGTDGPILLFRDGTPYFECFLPRSGGWRGWQPSAMDHG